MEKRSVQRGCLLVVVVLATILRVYDLGNLPSGFFCDEAGLGYNAFTIAEAGTDEHGNKFPLFFWSFGVSYKNPAYIYSAAIPVKLFGASEFSVRLTSALYGIATVIAVFFVGRALISAWAGFFAALFLALCPWHIHFSRIAFELIAFPFCFTVAMIFLVRFTQGRKTLPLAMLFFGLCFYTYQIANLTVPLFLIGFTLLYLPDLLTKRFLQAVTAFIVLVVTISPVLYFYYEHQDLTTQYFRNTTHFTDHEPTLVQAQRFFRYYQQFFSESFLFTNGDNIVRHAVRNHGELYWFYLPFMALGAIVCLFKRDRAPKLILWWLAVYPIAPSFMTEIPTASRGIIGVVPFCLLGGIGFTAALRLLGWVLRWRPLVLATQVAAVCASSYFLVPEVYNYLRDYIVEYPKYSAPTYGGFQYGYRDAIQYMESRRGEFDRLMLTAVEVNQPQVFPLFYRAVDPRKNYAERIGFEILNPAEYGRYKMDQRILYSLRPNDLKLFSDYEVHKRIEAPSGRVEFLITEVKKAQALLKELDGLGAF